MDRPTFSPFWHRVRGLRPRLRPHAEITRQHYRGRRWHVVHDPASNQFYRLSPVAHDFVGCLDGARTVEEAWKISLAKFGDAAPTQNEIIELLSQLHNTNLLSIDSAPETEQLLSRGRERVARRIKQQAIGIMYFRIPLFNPDRLLTTLEPIFRPLLNRWGLLLWVLVVGWAFLSILPVWPRLEKGFDDYFLTLAMSKPSEWAWMLGVFVVIKLIHEFGHGVVCKRFGGQVPEFGIMLLVLIPSPFVDASACWAFPNKWQRTAVGAAGMIFELFVAAIAALIWLNAVDGSFVHRVAYYAMVSASVATVLFNANPLMRFDGYYMLADLLEIPNLMPRSQQMLHAIVQKYLFRLRNVRFPSSQPSEQAMLIVFGIASGIYRIFLFVVITLYVLGQFFIIGVLLAVWTASVWFITPIGKLVHWLATSNTVAENRARTIFATLGIATAAALLIGVIPFPDWRRAQGVVESTRHSGVFFGTDGFVSEALVRPGERVREGQILARLQNPDLHRARASVLAQLRDADVRLASARAENKPGEVAIVENQVRVYRSQLQEIESRLAALELRAPHDGTIVAADPQLAVGAFVHRGEALCEIVDEQALRVTATLAQGDGAWFNELSREQYRVQMRFASDIPRVIEGGAVTSPAAALTALVHPALSLSGGGDIETDPRDPDGRVAKRGVFNIYIQPEADGPMGTPGEHVWLRFTLPSKPIAAQLIDRIQKTLQGRVNL
ncbi:MAG: PqqD family peptide modification chaperone [Phycisphaerales bacterium]